MIPTIETQTQKEIRFIRESVLEEIDGLIRREGVEVPYWWPKIKVTLLSRHE